MDGDDGLEEGGRARPASLGEDPNRMREPSEGAEPSPSHSKGHGVSLAALLAETFAVQALGTACVLTVPAIAPAVAKALALPAGLVGYQVALVYGAAMAMSLFAGTVVAAAGPCRTGQIAMVLAASGCLFASFASLPLLVLGSVMFGFAYGLINPSASELLNRHSPPHRRNVVFSIKQTGVPFGGTVAGLLAPALAVTIGYDKALWLLAAACLGVAAAAQRKRDDLDGSPGERNPRRAGIRLGVIREVLGDPAVRWLALASLVYSGVQLCAVAFLVTLLVEDFGLDLVRAGTVLAAVQVAGALGRIGWGFVADAVRDGLAVLLALGVLMALAAGAIPAFAGSAPLALVILILLTLGISAIGWNGVYMSELARSSGRHSVSATTGAAMVLTFGGVVIGPTIFSLVHARMGSYTNTYALLVPASLAGSAMIARVRFLRRR